MQTVREQRNTDVYGRPSEKRLAMDAANLFGYNSRNHHWYGDCRFHDHTH
jgi:hypothetical protein